MNYKKWFVVIVVLLFAGLVSAQGAKVLEFRVGYLNPKDTNSGLIFGGSYGISIDERVDISLGVSYFHKGYTKNSQVADTMLVNEIEQRTYVTELDYTTSILPISANVNMRFPMQPPLYWFAGGSVSYQLLFSNVKNYNLDVSDKRTYGGFGWMMRAGIEYLIGSRSSIIIEAFYNNAKVKRNVDETTAGLPIWDEVNLSGLGIRAGLRLEIY